MSPSDADNSQRESPLSVAQKWLPWCLTLIFAMTVGWTVLIALSEVSGGEYEGVAKTAIAVVSAAAPAAPLIVLYAILVVSVLHLTGGVIVVTAKYLGKRFVKPLREKLRAEGRTEGLIEGKAEERRKWIEWNQRRMNAEAEGVPFHEPPPS